MTPTKLRVLEAAVELLGTEGLRALTHARVDEQAGQAVVQFDDLPTATGARIDRFVLLRLTGGR